MLAPSTLKPQTAPLTERAACDLLIAAGATEPTHEAATALAALVASQAAQADAIAQPPRGFRARALKRVDAALADRARALVDPSAPAPEHLAIEAACLAAGAVAHARTLARPVDAVSVALAARDL